MSTSILPSSLNIIVATGTLSCDWDYQLLLTVVWRSRAGFIGRLTAGRTHRSYMVLDDGDLLLHH